MSLRGFATLNIWADDAAADWYAEFLGQQPYFSRPGRTASRRTSSSGSATRPTSSASSTAATPRPGRPAHPAG